MIEILPGAMAHGYPTQVEVVVDGVPADIRARGGHWSVRVQDRPAAHGLYQGDEFSLMQAISVLRTVAKGLPADSAGVPGFVQLDTECDLPRCFEHALV